MMTGPTHYSDPWERFPAMRLVKGFEGGGIYAAERDGKAYVIENESLLADMLTPGEDDDLLAALVRVAAFDSVAERDAYLQRRGWLRSNRTRWRP